jgi:hypothetical protein
LSDEDLVEIAAAEMEPGHEDLDAELGSKRK